MATTFISTASAAGSGASGPTCNTPAGNPGDLLVALMFSDNDGDFASQTAPSGWTERANGGNSSCGFGKIFTKTGAAGDASSYTFPGSSASAHLVVISRFRDWNPGAMFAIGPTFSAVGAGSTTSLIAPSVTPTRTGRLVCGWIIEGVLASASITKPSGMTGTSFEDSLPFLMNLLAYNDATSPANTATGTKTATASDAGGTATQGYLTVSMVISDAQLVSQRPGRRRGPSPARRRAPKPPITQTVVVQPAPTQRTAGRKRMAVWFRRGPRVAAGPPFPAAVIPPSRGPQPVGARPHALWSGRRPRRTGVAPVLAPGILPVFDRAPVKVPSVARRRPFAGPVPAQQAVVPPAYPPSRGAARVRAVFLRRSRGGSGPTPAQVAPTPPAYAPGPTGAAIRALFVRRPRPVPVPPPPAVPQPATWFDPVGPMKFRPSPARRARAGAGPAAGQQLVPPVRRPVPRVDPPGRRPHSFWPVPVTVLVPPFVPGPVRDRIRAVLGRRSRQVLPVLAPANVPGTWSPGSIVRRSRPAPARGRRPRPAGPSTPVGPLVGFDRAPRALPITGRRGRRNVTIPLIGFIVVPAGPAGGTVLGSPITGVGTIGTQPDGPSMLGSLGPNATIEGKDTRP